MDAEFEVYLDIDGAAEEEEEEEFQLQGSAYSALGHKNALHQIQKALPGSGAKRATAAMKLKSPSARDHGLSTPINVLDSDNSDLEVDVDTPFEGTLFGQTKPREQKQPGSTVLSALRNISQASLGLSQKGSSSASVARKSTTSTNSTIRRVAVKSASPRKPVKSSSAHVAKKSSTLQSRPISSSASSSSGISHGSADFLQVKFGPVKPVPPSDSLPVAFQSQFRTVNNLSSITTTLSSSITTTLSGTFGHPKQASSVTQASTSGTEKAPQCFKFSASKQNIDCPMCLLTMQQKSLSHHLKQKHNITLRVCTECKLAFTNVSVYSEHYAFHLQQEEDGHFGLPSVALPTKNQEIFSSEPVPLPDIRHKEPPESWTRTRSFKFLERSGDKRPCPECGTMIRQHSVRHHLKTVHDLNLRTCKICQLGYTDMNLYNEHCAFHYEQQEKKMEGQKKSLISETNSTNPTIPVVPPAEHLAKQTISLVRKAPEQNNTSRHILQSAPLSHVKSVQIKEEVFDDPLAHTVKSFEFKERSVEKIPCPECSQLIAQNSLRGHLQVVHSMSMKSCRKCPLAFTDTDAFFEHLACHYQQKGMNTLSSPPKNKRLSSPHLPLPALPPKPKAPSVAKPKNSPSKQPIPSSSGSYQASVADVPFPLQPKLPPKPRKPFLSKKRRLSPGLSTGCSESDREVVLEASYQTKARLNSDSTSRPTHYRSNQKAAVRKRQPSPSPATTRRPSSQSPSPVRRKQSGPASNIQLCPEPLRKRQSSGSPARRLSTRSPSPVRRKQLSSSPASKIHFSPVSVSKRQSSTSPVDQPPPKKTRTKLDVSREQIPKVKVNVVSLETAAQPFDCKTCLAANNLALVCPRSFRKYSQQKQKVFSCSNCPATFRQREQLKVHKELQCTSMSKQHFAHCGLQTDNENERGSEKSLHEIAKASLEKSEGDGNGVECIVCQEQFPYRSALLRHINYHTHQYCCSACKKSFADSIELLNHFQIVHNGKSQMLCRYCRKKFDHMSEFKRHLSGHKDGTVVACTVCGIKFSDSKKMLMHLRNEHCQGNPEESHVKDGRVCRTCGRVFKKAKQLAHHLRSAHGTRNPIVTKFLSCRICKTVFHKKQGLASHYLRRHGMSMPASLSTFAATKTGDGTAKPSRKNSQSDLQHQPGPPGSNTGVKGAAVQNSVADFDLDCPICKRRYSSRRTLLKHMTKIHQSKGSATIGKYSSYKCSFCKKTLYTPHGLKVHCQIVHGKQQSNSFKCIKCPKSFTRLANLKTHYRFHHGTKNPDAMPNFPCPICNQVYTTKKGMRYHWHKNHPESFQDNRVLPKKPNTSGSNTSVAETSSSTSCATSKITKPAGSSAKKHSCPLCERTFELRNSLFRHLQVNHGLTKSDIEYNFRNQTSVSNEKASTPRAPSASVNPKFFICKICKDCFSIRRSFMKHQRKVHGGKNGFFQCRSLKCKKTFSKLPGLQNHISKAHPGMSLYRCVACRTWFDTSDEVLCHICASVEDSEGASVKNSESGSTISQSESEPPGTSSSQVSLIEQEFRYRCLTCGAGFHISRDWTRHVQEHSKEANGRSADYEKVLDATDKIRLNIFDILSANNDSVFTCEHCSKIFTEAVALTSHVCKNQAACFEDVEKQKLAEECVESVAVELGHDMKELGDHDEHSSSEVKAAAVEESKHEKVEIGNLAAIGSSYHRAEPSEESKDSPVCDIGNSEPSVEDGEGERKVSLEKGGVTCGEEQCTSLDGVGRIQSPPGEEETLLASVDKPTPAMHDKLASSAEYAGKGTPEERKERVRTKDAGKPAPQIEELASSVEEAGKPASSVEEAGKPVSSVEEAGKPAPDEHKENLASSVEEAGKPAPDEHKENLASSVEEAGKPAPDEHKENLASSVEEAGKPAPDEHKENLASSVEDAGKLIHCQEEHEENLASSTEDASKPPPEAEEQLPSSNGEEQSPEGHEEQLPPSIGNPPKEHGQLPSSTKDAGIPSPGDEGNSETLETVILPTVEHKLNEKEDVPKGAENGSNAVTEETDCPDILNDSVESLTKAQEDELLMDEEGSHL